MIYLLPKIFHSIVALINTLNRKSGVQLGSQFVSQTMRHNTKITKTIAVAFFISAAVQLALSNVSLAISYEVKKKVIEDSIVKIYAVANIPDYYNPWNVSVLEKSGSGCIVSGNRILTSAHVVADQVFIEVQRYGQSRKYTARVLSVSHEADLALLTVDDVNFFSEAEYLDLGELPLVRDEILVYGFPIGGTTLSVTKGVVSRIEERYYTHSSEHFLAIQVDAAINPGNSGGPAIINDHIVGIVMQSYNTAENIAYLVPITIIKHFLRDIEDGRYDGFPNMGIPFQKMENLDMKRKFGMSDEQTGVRIIRVLPGSSAEGKLQDGDIILAVDNHNVGDDGTVESRPGEHVLFSHLFNEYQLGATINIKILRASQEKNIPVVLGKTQFYLISREQYDVKPEYFIFGGVVFVPLTKDLIKAWGSSWRNNAPAEFVAKLYDWPTKDTRELVVVLKILPAELNKGYDREDVSYRIIAKVNGKQFKDFDEFVQLVKSSNTPFIVFEDSKGYQIVLDRKEAEDSYSTILKTYKIK